MLGVEYLQWAASTLPQSQATLRVAVGTPVHTCPNCGRCYKFRSTLKRHLTYECGRASKSFRCSHCDKRISRLDNLRTHELTHRPLPARIEDTKSEPGLVLPPYQMVSYDGSSVQEIHDASIPAPAVILGSPGSSTQENSQSSFILTSLLSRDPLNSSSQDSQVNYQ